MPALSAVAASLWTVHTYTYESGDIAPKLGSRSPEKRCGKTTLTKVLKHTVNRGLPASGMTKPLFVRVMDKGEPTWLIEEADSDACMKPGEPMHNVMNLGHDREIAYTPILVPSPDRGWEDRDLNVFGPVYTASIGPLAGTIEDRSVILEMERKSPHEKKKKFRSGRVASLHELQRKAARWSDDNFAALCALLKDADDDGGPSRPPGLHDRAWDNWEVLVAIADLAGGEWPALARQAAIALSQNALLPNVNAAIKAGQRAGGRPGQFEAGIELYVPYPPRRGWRGFAAGADAAFRKRG